VLFQALIAALANSRQATSATKNRSRVAGGGAKPWRQKGTGRARQGSTRSPHWRHGGVVFGPNGRRYAQRLPAKMRRAAFAEALGAHAANGRVLVIESLGFDGVDGDRLRTRDVAGWLARVGDTGRSVLVTAEFDDRVGRAGANLKTIELRTPGTLRLADVLRAENVLVHRPAHPEVLRGRGLRRAAEAVQGDLAITALPAVGLVRGADEGQGPRAQPARAEAPTRGPQRAGPRDHAASRGRREAQLPQGRLQA